MYLTKEEERILEGGEGEGSQKAMELLVALGDIYGAEKFASIASAQISGVSYKTIGDAGLEFLKDLASKNARARVVATLNPMGVDLELSKEFGYPEKFVKKQFEILKAYVTMGILPTCTCTPYLIGNLPRFGESISWAESSAVVFANSVLGARTNRESGISALASAIVGKTPYYGLHLNKNRTGSLIVNVKAELSEADYSAMGYYIGKNYEGIPVFKNIRPSMEEMKLLSAALATGSISMFQVKNVTPEYSDVKAEKVEFGKEELKETYEMLNTCSDVDVICIGCPHCSIGEILDIAKLKPEREVWVFTAKQNKALVQKQIKNKNIKLISDTCMVVSPLEELGIRAVGVNSAKAAFYCSNLSKLEVRFDSLVNLIIK